MPELRRSVIDHLYLGPVFSQQRAQGGMVELSCQNNAMKAFRKEIPMLRVQWLLNGELLNVKPSRMLFKGENHLTITVRNLMAVRILHIFVHLFVFNVLFKLWFLLLLLLFSPCKKLQE